MASDPKPPIPVRGEELEAVLVPLRQLVADIRAGTVSVPADTSEWHYVPVRRLTVFLESSLTQGLQWVVFEPNGEPLWSSIRSTVGAFFQALYEQGAFQGATPSEAWFVRCDATTTTGTDIANGIVVIVVGFAPLLPAEFVMIQIGMWTKAGQAPAPGKLPGPAA
jgi:phage tail sheath protein FI